MLGGDRVPLSGAAGGSFGADVLLPNGWRCEVKSRADGWRTLYAQLEGVEVRALKVDRRPWLAVMRLDELVALLQNGDNRST